MEIKAQRHRWQRWQLVHVSQEHLELLLLTRRQRGSMQQDRGARSRFVHIENFDAIARAVKVPYHGQSDEILLPTRPASVISRARAPGSVLTGFHGETSSIVYRPVLRSPSIAH